MKAFLIAVIALLLLIMIGWLSLAVTSERTSINIETEAIREDTAGAIEATREFADDAVEGVNDAAEELDEHVDVDVRGGDDAAEDEQPTGVNETAIRE